MKELFVARRMVDPATANLSLKMAVSAVVVTLCTLATARGAQQVDMYLTGDIGDGVWRDYAMSEQSGVWRGTVENTASGWRHFVFRDSTANYDHKWGQSSGDPVLDTKYTVNHSASSDVYYNFTSSRYYTYTWKDVADYANSEMVLMMTSNAPVTFSSVSNSTPTLGDPIVFYATVSAAPSGEKVYLRYQTSGTWTGSTVVEMTNYSGATGFKYTIPFDKSWPIPRAYTYYCLTSAKTLLDDTDIDLYTISLGNNAGANYTYTYTNDWYASDTFNYTGTLDNQGGGAGWNTAWYRNAENPEPYAEVFSLHNPANYWYGGFGSAALNMEQGAADDFREVWRGFPAVTSGVLYVACKFKIDYSEISKEAGIRLMDGGTWKIKFGKVHSGFADTFNVFEASGGSAGAGGGSLNGGSDYTLVCRYDFDTGVIKADAVFGDMPMSEPTYPVSLSSPGGAITRIDRISLFGRNGSGDEHVGTARWDDLRIAKNWSDLTSVHNRGQTHPVVTNVILESNHFTDADLAASNFPVTVYFYDLYGVRYDSSTWPFFKPNIDLLNSNGVAYVSNMEFTSHTLSNGGESLRASNSTLSSVTAANITLGTHSMTWSAITSNEVSRLDNPYDETGARITFGPITDDDTVAPALARFGLPEGTATTNLQAGDIVIVGYHGDDTKRFSFLALVDVPADTEIRFTDWGWDNSTTNWGTSNEGRLLWTSPGAILPAGTVVTITNDSATSHGTVSEYDLGFALSTDGDSILAYQGSDADPAFIFALNADSGGWTDAGASANDTALPTGLNEGSSAVNIGTPETDNGYYAGITADHPGGLRAAVCTYDNWTMSDTPTTFPDWTFSVNGARLLVTLNDGQINSGGWSLTGLVNDAASGIDADGTPGGDPFPPHFDLFVSDGGNPAAWNNVAFDTRPADGGASGITWGSLANTSIPGIDAADVETGAYTALVYVADNDNDRLNDRLNTVGVFTFDVIDDDTNGPSISTDRWTDRILSIDISDAASGVYDPAGHDSERVYYVYDDDGDLSNGVDGTNTMRHEADNTYTAVVALSEAYVGGKTITYRVYAHDNDNDRLGDRTAETYDGNQAWGLDAPTALTATATNDNGFTANWSLVPGADEYRLDVSTNRSFLNAVVGEDFAGFTGGILTQPVDGDFHVTGWYWEYCYENTGTPKMGTDSDRGILTTPALDLSSSDATIAFEAKRYSTSDNSQIIVQHVTGGSTTDVQTVVLTDVMRNYTVIVAGGTAASKVQFYAKNKTEERYYIDNITVGLGESYVAGYSNKTVTGASATVSGLSSETTYYYRLRAAGSGGAVSDNSNIVTVKTEADTGIPNGTLFRFR